jgi:hypothetical protein
MLRQLRRHSSLRASTALPARANLLYWRAPDAPLCLGSAIESSFALTIVWTSGAKRAT